MLAAAHGALARVEALIAWHVDVNAASNAGGITALFWASGWGHVEVVRALLAAGAGVNAADDDGNTMLIFASYNGHVEVARALLAAGTGVDAANNDDDTALFTASYRGHVEVVRVLLAAGADKHLIALNGDTAYSDAANTPGSTDAIRALLDLAS